MRESPSPCVPRALVMLGLIYLSLLVPLPTSAQQQPPSDSLSEQIALRVEVMGLRRRVERLEEEIARLIAALDAGDVVSQGAQPSQTPPVRATGGAWTNPSNWGRVTPGMSERQVISILGPPTKRERIRGSIYLLLFYQGEVPGSGFVSGNVRFLADQDRVLLIQIPIF